MQGRRVLIALRRRLLLLLLLPAPLQQPVSSLGTLDSRQAQ